MSRQILHIWRFEGIDIHKIVVGQFKEDQQVHLFHCRNCGFEFFDPRFVGSEAFYSTIHAQMPGYYAPARPENLRNALFARKRNLRSILDVGCGTGAALDVARDQGLETYGIEFNPDAAAEARSRGHTIFSNSIEDLVASEDYRFDLVSLNQVLEHVPDPVGMIENCVNLLSRRGFIAIAVPNSIGILRLHPWVASNWPPHHLSRWRRKDFATLARLCNLRVLKAGGDQLLGSALRDALLANREHCLALGKPYRGLGPLVIRFVAFLYRKSGMKVLFRGQGHSIFCFLERQPSL